MGRSRAVVYCGFGGVAHDRIDQIAKRRRLLPERTAMISQAKTVDEYLASLPEDRRAAISAVREVIRKNLDKDYEEGMGYGMMGWSVPHRVYPPGYHCDPRQPLPFAGIASQKNYMSVYLMCVYFGADEEKWFRDAWAKTGKKLDMGKSCIRFKKLDDLALNVIGQAVERVPAAEYIRRYEASKPGGTGGKSARPKAKGSRGSKGGTASKNRTASRVAVVSSGARATRKSGAKKASRR